MFQRLLFLLLISLSLHAELKDPYVLASTEGDPAARLCPLVNSLTGDLVLQETDLVVAGADRMPASKCLQIFVRRKAWLLDPREEY